MRASFKEVGRRLRCSERGGKRNHRRGIRSKPIGDDPAGRAVFLHDAL
jgi:hypothetical protein